MTLADQIDITSHMNEHQRAWFYSHYEHARRDKVIGVLLAIFFGCFGLHHFYLRRTGRGILYLCFFWTGIPTLAGWIEAFFMPRRVRAYNAVQATRIAGQIRATHAFSPSIFPLLTIETPCPACGGPVEATAAFCPHCGQKTTSGARALAAAR